MPLLGPSTPVVTLTNTSIPAYRVENRRLMIMSSGTHLQDQVRAPKGQVLLLLAARLVEARLGRLRTAVSVDRTPYGPLWIAVPLVLYRWS